MVEISSDDYPKDPLSLNVVSRLSAHYENTVKPVLGGKNWPLKKVAA